MLIRSLLPLSNITRIIVYVLHMFYICLPCCSPPPPLLCLQIEPQFAAAEQKNKLLRSVAGGGVDELPQLRTRWDKFEIMMESHQMMVRDQVSMRNKTVFREFVYFWMCLHAYMYCTCIL